MKVLFLLLLLSISGNEPSENEISYRVLSWSDFRGSVPKNEYPWAAMSATTMEMEINGIDGKFKYAVKAYFLPDSSYVRLRTKEILRHEQTHFQIAYIASLRCMRDLAALQGGDSTARNKADKIFDAYGAQKNTIDDQFDRETDHSRNKEAEYLWERRILHQLNLMR